MGIPIENKRVRDIIELFCNGNELQFSKEIGISQPRINRLFSVDIRNNKYPLVTIDIIKAIINKYINVNVEALITGHGDILKGKLETSKKVVADANDSEKLLSHNDVEKVTFLENQVHFYKDQVEFYKNTIKLEERVKDLEYFNEVLRLKIEVDVQIEKTELAIIERDKNKKQLISKK
ncbi:hypothetical protein [Flavobacterium sp.]|uniref:hypothetical protein n=1 Tax=Flavobacterium sp. TaxID=239 RepID=UPI003752D20B